MMYDNRILQERIESARQRLGKKLLILARHYQRDEVVRHADLIGDSFQLSKAVLEFVVDDYRECETIIFCGVHFMAETADLLANSPENLERRGGKRVNALVPEPRAGCSIADVASCDAAL